MKQEDLERIAYAQGWIGNQTSKLQPKDEQEQVLFAQWQDMWKALDADIDKLVAEGFKMIELENKLATIKALTRTPVEQKLEQIGDILDT